MRRRQDALDVSIIIVNWNTRDVLRDCLRSVYDQTRGIAFEVIVVDNASSDGSVAMVRREFPEVTVIENPENVGFAAANNQGMAAAAPRYYLLLNPDTVILDGAVQKTFEYAQRDPGAAVVGCKVWSEDGTLQGTTAMYPRLFNMLLAVAGLPALIPNNRLFGRAMMWWWDHNDTREVESVAGCFMLVRREAVDRVGMMDERYFMYAEEIDWCLRFHRAGWKIVYFHEAAIKHLIGKSSTLSERDMNLERRKSLLAYFRKNRGVLTAWVANVIFAFGDAVRIVGWSVAQAAVRLAGRANPERGKRLRSRAATLKYHVLGVDPQRERVAPLRMKDVLRRAAKVAVALFYYVLVTVPRGILTRMAHKPRRDLVVLAYHGVRHWQRPGLAWQMDELLRAGRPVSLEEIASGNLPEGAARFVAVTFDDAFENILKNGLPELEVRKIPATVFAPSGNIDLNPAWRMREGSTDRRESVMSGQDLRALRGAGVGIGSHGVRHVRIGRISDDEAQRELEDSKRRLEEITGRPVTLVAFPHGDFNRRTVELAQKAGYARAFTIEPKVSALDSREFLIGRMLVEPDEWALEFRLKLRGAYEWMAPLRRLGKRVRALLGKVPPSGVAEFEANIGARRHD